MRILSRERTVYIGRCDFCRVTVEWERCELKEGREEGQFCDSEWLYAECPTCKGDVHKLTEKVVVEQEQAP